ncbi:MULTISPECIES: hypothetical protein [unclassified Bacillus (in: firmicutes)]|uniref:hypothetical protein n=1 Tax=unclassified Bacillus (in: firmicutes) TaxID=185979 RepID=UPI001596CCAB|nr:MULTISPECIES: hypothetical protein [unclassified Bacillus (in: firmicutes)]
MNEIVSLTNVTKLFQHEESLIVFWSLVMYILFYIYIFTNLEITTCGIRRSGRNIILCQAGLWLMGSSMMTIGIAWFRRSVQGLVHLIWITSLWDTVYFAAQMLGQSVIHLLSIMYIF